MVERLALCRAALVHELLDRPAHASLWMPTLAALVDALR
ncbi:MAG: hypothetical protein ACI9S9_005126 [Planctomycetota bacterium]|jgi:hypothetical protein